MHVTGYFLNTPSAGGPVQDCQANHSTVSGLKLGTRLLVCVLEGLRSEIYRNLYYRTTNTGEGNMEIVSAFLPSKNSKCGVKNATMRLQNPFKHVRRGRKLLRFDDQRFGHRSFAECIDVMVVTPYTFVK